MKIKIIEKIEREKEYDVNFPIYRQHDLSSVCDYERSCVIYTRIEENLRAVHIELDGINKANIEIESKYVFKGDDINYHLGKEEHESSKEEFEKALKKAKEIITKI